MPEKQIIPVVIAVLYKEVGPGNFLIMTQLRRVLNPAYDSLYDGTWEAMGETLKPGEDHISALLRGIEEECGQKVPEGPPAVRHTTGKGDIIVSSLPFCVVQSIAAPQLWFAVCYKVQVLNDWEPDFSKADGEATEACWWKPDALKRAIEESPARFMGLHMPVLYKLAEELDPE